MKVILMGGKKRNGKDTHAERLEKALVARGLKVDVEHFATPLKSILIECGVVTGLEENKAKERPLFQKFGNEVMKKWFGNNVWADAMKILLLNKVDTDVVIIPDFRYPCEVEVLTGFFDLFTFHIERLGYVNEVDTHSSENALDHFPFESRFLAGDFNDIDINVNLMTELIDA